MKIMNILKRWKAEAGAKRVIQFRYSKGVLTIYTSQPGFLIGKAGKLHEKYNNIFENELQGFKKIMFVETDYYWV